MHGIAGEYGRCDSVTQADRKQKHGSITTTPAGTTRDGSKLGSCGATAVRHFVRGGHTGRSRDSVGTSTSVATPPDRNYVPSQAFRIETPTNTSRRIRLHPCSARIGPMILLRGNMPFPS